MSSENNQEELDELMKDGWSYPTGGGSSVDTSEIEARITALENQSTDQVYSTEPVKIGTYGSKTVYRKVMTGKTASSNNTNSSPIGSSIPYGSTLLRLIGSVSIDNANHISYPFCFYDNDTYYYGYLRVTTNSVQEYHYGASYHLKPITVVVEYAI